MRTRCSRDAADAFTLIEVLVVLAIIAILFALLLPMRNVPDRSPRVKCMRNLRQVLIGVIEWQGDHSNSFPWQVSTDNGGSMELAEQGNVFPHFRVIGKYVPPMHFVCPSDKSRKAADSAADVVNENLSYFLNLDGGTSAPASIVLIGDRNLQIDDRPAKAELFNTTTNSDLNWTRDLHRTGGNLGFADGHAEFSRINMLNIKFREQHIASSRLVIP